MAKKTTTTHAAKSAPKKPAAKKTLAKKPAGKDTLDLFVRAYQF